MSKSLAELELSFLNKLHADIAWTRLVSALVAGLDAVQLRRVRDLIIDDLKIRYDTDRNELITVMSVELGSIMNNIADDGVYAIVEVPEHKPIFCHYSVAVDSHGAVEAVTKNGFWWIGDVYCIDPTRAGKSLPCALAKAGKLWRNF